MQKNKIRMQRFSVGVGGYEFHSYSGTGNCLLHASMTMQFPIPEYGVNGN